MSLWLPRSAAPCEGERWGRLFEALQEASRRPEFLEDFSPAMFELTQYEPFAPRIVGLAALDL